MRGQEFRQALHRGDRVYGTAITGAGPLYAQALKGLGLDWVFIDNEHSPMGRESTSWLCQTYKVLGIVPIVRIPYQEPALAAIALDGGAQGVIVPYTEDPALVRQMVGATKLRPLKGERLTALLEGGPGLEERAPAYEWQRNLQTSLIINVESVPAMGRLDDLCSVEGLDAVLIGPHDLSVSLEVPEQYDHPRFVEAVLHILRTARAHGLGAGIHYWFNAEQELFFIREGGANLIVHGTEVTLASDTLRTVLHTLRMSLDDEKGSRGADDLGI